MGGLNLILSVILSAVVIYTLVHEVYVNRYNFNFAIAVWKGFSVSKLIEVILLLGVVIYSYELIVYYIPVLKFGWLDLMSTDANSLNGIVISTAKDISPSYSDVFIVIFLLLFISVLPFLAKFEEEAFRKGHHTFKEIVTWSFIFGFVHLLMGIPVALGFSLTITGLFLSYKYHRVYMSMKELYGQKVAEEEALFNSTVYHTLYNTVIFLIVLLAVI